MPKNKTTIIEARELERGDRIDDGSSTGLILKSVRVYAHNTRVLDTAGWGHSFANDSPVTVWSPRRSGLKILDD